MAGDDLPLDALCAPADQGVVRVPRFDKARDDRQPHSSWDHVQGALDLVLLEGWCLGVRPQSTAELLRPVNALEVNEDPDARWRGYVNAVLAGDYLPLYSRFDLWVMLQAPSFGCVYDWRLEQERKLADTREGGADAVMSAEEIARFIQHYQRLTQHGLATLPPAVDYLYTLDAQRSITASRPRWEPAV